MIGVASTAVECISRNSSAARTSAAQARSILARRLRPRLRPRLRQAARRCADAPGAAAMARRSCRVGGTAARGRRGTVEERDDALSFSSSGSGNTGISSLPTIRISTYVVLTTDGATCTSAGLYPIASASECETAVAAINAANGWSGHDGGTIGELSPPAYPLGCFSQCLNEAAGYFCVSFNTADTSHGVGSSIAGRVARGDTVNGGIDRPEEANSRRLGNSQHERGVLGCAGVRTRG